MTVIVWDGRTLASDRRATDTGGIARSVTKIMQANGCLVGLTGGWDVGAELRAWWIAGAAPDKFPAKARDDIATLIVIGPEGIDVFAAGPFPMRIQADQCAFGSGRDFAEAAMHLGCTAARAVEVACKFQVDCGGGVDKINAPWVTASSSTAGGAGLAK